MSGCNQCDAGKGCSFQAASKVEMVFKRPKEVKEFSKKVGCWTAKFIRWTGSR